MFSEEFIRGDIAVGEFAVIPSNIFPTETNGHLRLLGFMLIGFVNELFPVLINIPDFHRK